jgi:hypothetical protein
LEPSYEEFTITEFLIGKDSSSFKGIYPLIKKFMEIKNYNEKQITKIESLLEFLLARAKGKIPTGAKFLR